MVKGKKAVKKIVKEVPTEKKVGIFDYIDSVLRSKVNLMRGSNNDGLMEKGYNAFMTNKALSFHVDTILYANELNRRSHLDNLLQYEYLLNTVRAMKRPRSWVKKQEAEHIALIQEKYQVNSTRAHEMYSIIGDDGVEEIKKSMITGGTIKNKWMKTYLKE